MERVQVVHAAVVHPAVLLEVQDDGLAADDRDGELLVQPADPLGGVLAQRVFDFLAREALLRPGLPDARLRPIAENVVEHPIEVRPLVVIVFKVVHLVEVVLHAPLAAHLVDFHDDRAERPQVLMCRVLERVEIPDDLCNVLVRGVIRVAPGPVDGNLLDCLDLVFRAATAVSVRGVRFVVQRGNVADPCLPVDVTRVRQIRHVGADLFDAQPGRILVAAIRPAVLNGGGLEPRREGGHGRAQVGVGIGAPIGEECAWRDDEPAFTPNVDAVWQMPRGVGDSVFPPEVEMQPTACGLDPHGRHSRRFQAHLRQGRHAVCIRLVAIEIDDSEARCCACRQSYQGGGPFLPPRPDLRFVGRRVLEAATGRRAFLLADLAVDHVLTFAAGEHRNAPPSEVQRDVEVGP